jgi:hypothetical protein
VSNRAHRVAVTVLIVLIILALAYLLRSVLNPPMPQVPEPKTPPVSQASDIATETVKANAHPIHKGGVHSVTEVLRLMNSDPAVAAHYRGFGFRPECANTMILAVNTFARVSYRTDSGFAWTRTPVLLLAGENLIVDCAGHIIRAACANAVMLAEKSAQTDTGELFGDLTPPAEILPTPDTPQPIAPIPSGPVPPVLPPTGTGPYPAPCCFVAFAPPVGPPVSTDEGGSTLFFAGTAILLLIFASKRKTDAN